jgi:hypothetical protein
MQVFEEAALILEQALAHQEVQIDGRHVIARQPGGLACWIQPQAWIVWPSRARYCYRGTHGTQPSTAT